jgi:hypothetical protein
MTTDSACGSSQRRRVAARRPNPSGNGPPSATGLKTRNVQPLPCNESQARIIRRTATRVAGRGIWPSTLDRLGSRLVLICQRTPAPIRPVISPKGPTHPRYYPLSKRGGMRWKHWFAFLTRSFFHSTTCYQPLTNDYHPPPTVHKFNRTFENIALLKKRIFTHFPQFV